MQQFPQISVQPDWHEVVRDVVGQTALEGMFWVSCYKKDSESVHGTVLVKRGNQPRSVELEGQQGVTVKYINSVVHCAALGLHDVMIYAPKLGFNSVDNRPAVAIDLTSDGELYALAQDKRIILGKLNDGKCERMLEGHLADVTTVQFFPSNQVVLSGGSDFQAKIWSVLDGSNPVTLRGHTSSSSRDGTIRLWHCGSSETIHVLAQYKSPVTKMLLDTLPAGSTSASQDNLADEREFETADKLVIAALGDGSVKGIHLGTKEEMFATHPTSTSASAVAHHSGSGLIVTGDERGTVRVFSLEDLTAPRLQWQRSEHAVTGLLIKLDQNGELVVFVANADGSVYHTSPILPVLKNTSSLKLAAEYSGNELETVHSMKAIPSSEASNHHQQQIICCNRSGNVLVY
ncbi:WD40-repeat-containing domain protein [Dichotomocladium elegans]|nr:WD40-repeat-containing domain protein [Dichotomocladium elegans]